MSTEEDYGDQGFTSISEGCPACKKALIQTERLGQWWWTCPNCRGSYGHVRWAQSAVTVNGPSKIFDTAELRALIEKAALRMPTAAELFEQRVSYCFSACSAAVSKDEIRAHLRALGYGQ